MGLGYWDVEKAMDRVDREYQAWFSVLGVDLIKV